MAINHASKTREQLSREIADLRAQLAAKDAGAGALTIESTQEGLVRADSRLRRETEWFMRAFEHHPDALVISRVLDGLIERVNPAFLDLFGYTHRELIGKSSVDLGMTEPFDRRKFTNELDIKGTVSGTGIEIRTKAGTVRKVNFSVVKIGPDGDSRIMTVIQDVTEREKTMQNLRASQEQLRRHAEEVETLMEMAPVAIWVSRDPDCNSIIIGNREANSFYEASGQENVSANISPARRFFSNGKELAPAELPMQAAAAGDIDIRNTELDVLLPSGKWLSMLGSASPLHDTEGRVRGCIATFLNITERRQTERKLQETLRRYELVVTGAEAGIWEWDVSRGKVVFSSRWKAMRGFAENEIGDD